MRSLLHEKVFSSWESHTIRTLWTDSTALSDHTFWNWIDQAIESFIADETVTHDLLLVSGPRATDPPLQSILR
jgi:hypothetical protein